MCEQPVGNVAVFNPHNVSPLCRMGCMNARTMAIGQPSSSKNLIHLFVRGRLVIDGGGWMGAGASRTYGVDRRRSVEVLAMRPGGKRGRRASVQPRFFQARKGDAAGKQVDAEELGQRISTAVR